MDARESAVSYSKNMNFESIADTLMHAENGLEAALFAIQVYRALPTIELRAAFLRELET